MSIRTAFPFVLLAPLFGFVAWQVLEQRQEAAHERDAAVMAAAPIQDFVSPAPSTTTAAVPEPTAPPPTATVSNGGADPSPTAVGARDIDDIRRRLQVAEHGTYLNEILLMRDSGLARWPERVVNPLRVWVQSAKTLPGWNERYPDRVREAFETWSLSGIPVKFTYVRDSVDADVVVVWLDRFDDPITGRTLWRRDRNWWIVDGSLTLALHHTSGEQLDEQAIHAIALHEVGHLLGLDHCTDSTNIMTPRVRVRDLSNADRATIRLLYSLPPGSIK